MSKRTSLKSGLVLTLGMGVCAQFSWAEDIDCENAATQTEMNICSSRAAQAADAELNAVWSNLRAKTKAFDQDVEMPAGEGVSSHLLAAQRAWITFRDNQCNAEGAQHFGGTIRPTIQNACIQRMTEARIQELRAMMRDR